MGGKRISSLFDGFTSGLIFGIVIGYLIFLYLIGEPIPVDLLTAMLIVTMLAIAILAYGVHSALKTKEP